MAHPEQLGKYRITSVLGEGAMGVVYRGFDPDIRRVVALKTIRRGVDTGETAATSAARFRNEARAAGRLTHPGIVGVYDFGESDSAAGRITYIAMEYVEGHNLSAYLARKVPFSAADIASVGAQLLEALAHAHENAVWHRDIKPANIIMTRSGRVKIADFGIARSDDSGLTMAGGMVGTPMYMSPEQFLGGAIDHRVDLYSVGVVLYQMIAGRPPFVGNSDVLTYRVVHEPAQPPSVAEGAWPLPQFDEVVVRALAKDPAKRYPHAAAFRNALAGALGEFPPPTVSEEAVNALPSVHAFAATERMPPPSPSGVMAAPPSMAGSAGSMGSVGSAGTLSAIEGWDPTVLAAVQAALARHVGPLAATMVRRAARECADLPSLQLRLAEQITQVAARNAFLSQVRGGTGTGSGAAGRASGVHAAPPPTGSGLGSLFGGRLAASSPSQPVQTAAPFPTSATGGTGGSMVSQAVSDALLEQVQRVLASYLGPIARVVLKRALDRTRQREPLFALLAEAAPESARAKLLAELGQLR